MNRKALTPLLATILLLVFALVIGTITMNWGKEYVDQLALEDPSSAQESVISESNVDNPLKQAMVDYIEGKITQEEYDERVKELSS